MAIGEAHCRYTRRVNSRKKVRGYLFQGRFHVGLRKRDVLVQDRDLPGLESKWRRYLRDDDELSKLVQDKTQTGSPCGSESFVRKIARRAGRAPRPDKPGPKPNGQRVGEIVTMSPMAVKQGISQGGWAIALPFFGQDRRTTRNQLPGDQPIVA